MIDFKRISEIKRELSALTDEAERMVAALTPEQLTYLGVRGQQLLKHPNDLEKAVGIVLAVGLGVVIERIAAKQVASN